MKWHAIRLFGISTIALCALAALLVISNLGSSCIQEQLDIEGRWRCA